MNLEEFYAINSAYPWFFAFWAFVFGACWGSFFNVVIYRYPAKLSVVKPGSHCFACQTPIKWYDNLPILSWCILRGKARCCGAPFSMRYAIIEALTGGLYMWTWIVYSDDLGVVVAIWIFLALLICGLFIDYDTQFLPDLFTVWGLVFGFILSCLYPELHQQGGSGDPPLLEHIRSAALSATGGVVGAGVILWVGLLAEKFLRKEEAMGFGDVLLMGCIGAFIGWKGAIFAIFGGSLFGTLVVLPMMLVNSLFGTKLRPGKTGEVEEMAPPKKMDEAEDAETTEPEADLNMQAKIPFGPWLAIGAVVYLLLVRDCVDGYFESTRALIFSPVPLY
ncbi:prepilin peptidase [Cerasicoccus arenae]|uniref:Type 4 prepilin-like proteins leader peptide-processing enzyme n=1 Tax=Cerasicoccus arenae TaxID=424488 RepID=A0A8J3DEM5_9BACT|nr:A24 family peptidase [Cerasicoccus arenae]MBK1858504.1 prepilin peptidase [Cerasicoccus arenae]GHC10217.1 type 4 prepilin-like proteins leader peptide-processing enzyme [Cerasicoccus arenae]